MRIILDFRKRAILIPREVIEAIGSKTDFGFLYDTDYTQILITLDNPAVPVRLRRVGRKPRHRSNTAAWNVAEQCFEMKMGVAAFALHANIGLEPGCRTHFSVSGETVADNAAVFAIDDAAEILEDRDLAGYKVVPPSMFRLVHPHQPHGAFFRR
ncbi:MAG: hypothetical protein IJ088_03775 [Clostridia bacterium]|nr:hypothetical protein [Clostridia bacterium]